MDAARYPEYRKPKMPWLPEVPAHWVEQRAKVFFREIDERSRNGSEELLSVSHLTGVTPRSQKNVTMFKAESYVGHKLCRPGDIVVNTLWAWMAALGAARHTGLVSPAYGVYRPHSPVSFNPAYLDYLLRTRAYVSEYNCRSTGIRASRLRLYPNQFLDIPLIQPPRAEQDQIVAYLRVQDAHIARFIKAKRELIEQLNEQKQTIAQHAVTKGLDANVPLITSGLSWLGNIPNHWKVLRIKAVLNESSTRTSTGDEVLLSLSRYKGLVPFHSLSSRPPSAKDFSQYKLCRPGQLVMNRMQAWSGLFAEATTVGLISPDYSVFDVKPISTARYLEYVFKTKMFIQQFAIESTGIGTGFNRLYTPQFGAIPIVLPPIDEQVSIVEWLDRQFVDVNNAIVRASDEISLIKEYRDRLIADVVTGQVDVRDWVPVPDDEVAGEDLGALAEDDNENIEEDEPDGAD